MRKLPAVWLLIVGLLLPAQGWAAAAFRSASNTTYANRTNTTITAPAGIQDGDVLILAFGLAAATPGPAAPTAPSGFALVTGTWPIALTDTTFDMDIRVYYKIASGESGDYTITHAAASSQGLMFAVSGGTSAQPAATTNSATSGTTTTALGLTTSGNDALVAFIGFDWASTSNNLTAPSGSTPTFTERIDVAPLIYLATGVLSAAGATGNKTMTNNGSTSANTPWAGMLVAIEASGGASAETFGFLKRRPQ